MPAAREVALASLGSFPEGKESDDIARIRVKDLLLRRVRRSADFVGVDLFAEVLDVSQHDVGGLSLPLVVLSAPSRSNVGGHAGVDDDVLFSSVVVYGDAANYLETVSVMEFLGDAAKSIMQFLKRKGLLADLSKGDIKSYHK